MRQSWNDTFVMPCVEFFNVASYRIDKQEQERKDMEKWRITH